MPSPHSISAVPEHPGKLHILTCVTNYNRYRIRASLYRAFAKQAQDAGAVLYTAECALGSRPFEVTQAGNPFHLQVRVEDELWHKENLLNLLAARLPEEAEYIATVDADVKFTRADWVQETIQQLQHYQAVQMFGTISCLGPSDEILGTARPGFVEAWMRGSPLQVGAAVVRKQPMFHPNLAQAGTGYSGTYGPPGGAWAYRRATLSSLGGLMDFCVLGSGDFFMALGLIGSAQYRIPARYSPGLRSRILSWQANAVRQVGKNIGVVPGSLLHCWHGGYESRFYDTREKILEKYQFDPTTDLKPNLQGVLTLVNDGSARYQAMRDDLRSYFQVRNEDAV